MTTLSHIFVLLQEQSILLASDKIYSVLAILLIIFGSLVVYLILTQRKISKLEQHMDQLEQKD